MRWPMSSALHDASTTAQVIVGSSRSRMRCAQPSCARPEPMLHATIVGSARRRQLRRNASASSGCDTSLIASGVASSTCSGSMSSSSARRRASAIGAVPMPTIAITTPLVRGSSGGGGSCASRWHSAVRRSPVTAVDGASSTGRPSATQPRVGLRARRVVSGARPVAARRRRGRRPAPAARRGAAAAGGRVGVTRR